MIFKRNESCLIKYIDKKINFVMIETIFCLVIQINCFMDLYDFLDKHESRFISFNLQIKKIKALEAHGIH